MVAKGDRLETNKKIAFPHVPPTPLLEDRKAILGPGWTTFTQDYRDRNSLTGGPVIRTLYSVLPRAQVQTSVGELRSHKPNGMAKNETNKKNKKGRLQG